MIMAGPHKVRLRLSRFSQTDIRRYYDRNTAAFVALGQGGSVGAIHRAVWGPGVRTSEEAFRYVEDQIAERLRHLPLEIDRPHVVDLGCGVGASLCYLAERLPGLRGTGITLSPVQARFAEKRVQQAGLSDRVTCLEGDYADVPASVSPADLAYAIESFVHGPDPSRFFAQCRQLMRPGGLLMICDDVKRPTDDPAARRAIERFKRGWHINTLIDRSELQTLAREAGFEHDSTVDLSSYLELNRPRDRAIEVLISLTGWVPVLWSRLDHLVGGSALQQCLGRGWIGYDLAVFRRVD
jgi:cyclopropane fatty-acyl-phospholipid synthase-like methyltransferase